MSDDDLPIVDQAVTALRTHFTNVRGDPIRTPYYLSQLQVLYETDFFPWVVSDAIKKLTEEEGFLTRFDSTRVPDLDTLTNVTRISFYANSAALEGDGEDRIKTRILTIARLVDRYSDPQNSQILGKHLEALVKAELRAQGFLILKEHDNEYDGTKWTRTEHDLDFIAKLPDTHFAIGVEVKNTLDLMHTDEIDIKIDICDALGIVPVFAVRWIKPYIDCIRKQNGFSWLFKTQMYPLGQESLVTELYAKLSELDRVSPSGRQLQWPVIVRTELPPKSVSKFHDWVLRVKHDPPTVDTTSRCSSPREEVDSMLEPESLP